MDRLRSNLWFLCSSSGDGRITSTHTRQEQSDIQSSHPLSAGANDCIRQFLSFSSLSPLFSLQISQLQTRLDFAEFKVFHLKDLPLLHMFSLNQRHKPALRSAYRRFRSVPVWSCAFSFIRIGSFLISAVAVGTAGCQRILPHKYRCSASLAHGIVQAAHGRNEIKEPQLPHQRADAAF